MGTNNVEEGIALLKQMSQKEGFDVIILLWPDFMDKTIIEAESYPGKVKRTREEPLMIELIAKQHGIPTFRLSEYFLKDFEKVKANNPSPSLTPKSYYTVDGMHAIEPGCRVAAEAMETILKTQTTFL